MNIAIFLDEVNEFNGPLMFIPGSHKLGVLEAGHDLTTTSYPLWTIDNDNIRSWSEGGRQGRRHRRAEGSRRLDADVPLLPGARGSSNMSPWNRVIVYLSLCAVSNHIRRSKRVEWIAHRDFTPIEMLPDDCLRGLPGGPAVEGRHAGERCHDLRHRTQASRLGRPMNLHALLQRRQADGKPLRVGLIGAGKFGSMFLSQARRTPGIRLIAVADLSPARAREALARVGWPASGSGEVSQAALTLRRARGADADRRRPRSTSSSTPPASRRPASRHVLACCQHGKHVVMVNVEADALAGPLLARKAHEAGIVYSLAYGDQPALICELVDWARAAGFEVIAAGKGTKYLPAYHASTPDTVWDHYGLTPENAQAGGMNAQMFNSFLDGTKSRDRDGRGRQRHRPRLRRRRPRLPGLRRRRPAARAAAARRRRRARPPRPGRGDLERSSATAGRCSATCAGAST